jgi:hypothetical protein
MHGPLPNRRATDTSDDAAEAQYRVMRAMSPSRKVALVEDANRTARRLIELLLGEELAGQAFGPRGLARGR